VAGRQRRPTSISKTKASSVRAPSLALLMLAIAAPIIQWPAAKGDLDQQN